MHPITQENIIKNQVNTVEQFKALNFLKNNLILMKS